MSSYLHKENSQTLEYVKGDKDDKNKPMFTEMNIQKLIPKPLCTAWDNEHKKATEKQLGCHGGECYPIGMYGDAKCQDDYFCASWKYYQPDK
jgi:hypothetical protein